MTYRFFAFRFLCALAATGAALLCLPATEARADAIDGDWCTADKRMTIRGPEITTPGGKQIRGNYDRHSFSYVVPAGETGAGENVWIVLRGEYLALARQGAADAPVTEWKRCSANVS